MYKSYNTGLSIALRNSINRYEIFHTNEKGAQNGYKKEHPAVIAQ
jgi:hypothetical protein